MSVPNDGTATTREPSGEVIRIARQILVVGWVMVAWAGIWTAFGCFFGRPQLIAFYSLVIVMGWQALRVSAVLREKATKEPDEAIICSLGRAYLLQSWLVIAWIVLGILTMVYFGLLTSGKV